MGEAQAFQLYGVMAAGAAPALAAGGIGGSHFRWLPCGELLALLKPQAVGKDPEPSCCPDSVLITAMKAGPIIPADPGLCFASEEEVCRFLAATSAAMETALAYLAGLVEVNLKAVWRKEAFLTDIDAPELQALSIQIAQSPADLPPAESVSQLVERLINERRAWYTGQICSPLQAETVSLTLTPLPPTRTVFHAAFLLGADDQEEFYRSIEYRTRPYEDRLEFHYSGPWPPHHFGLIHAEGLAEP